MEKVAFLKSFIKKTKIGQRNKSEDDNIVVILNELSKLNPTNLSEDDYKKLKKYLPLSPNIYSYEVLAATCKLIASLCTDDLARNNFGQSMTASTVNILKSLINQTTKEQSYRECLLQTCRAIGNLIYYHNDNTMYALQEECLSLTMEVLRANSEENFQPVLNGLLLNLTHLNNYSYKFPVNMIEDINSFGIKCVKSNNNNYGSYINLIWIMIRIIRESSSNNKITDYEKCSVVDWLLEHYNTNIEIASICVKFISQVSKTYNVYNWILKGKHKLLVTVLDIYEDNSEEDAKHIVKKICDIITLISNDDGSMDPDYNFEVLYLVEWLLLKVNSKNLYTKLSAVRSLGNFSRFKYSSCNTIENPANTVMKHISWFINTLDKSTEDKNSLMEISILCLFKNMLYVTSFESIDEINKDKLIKTTIEVLNNSTFNPVVMKTLEVIPYIIKKGGMNEKHLVLYKTSTFTKLITAYCNNANEEIRVLANKLHHSINEDILLTEIDVSNLIESNLQIKN